MGLLPSCLLKCLWTKREETWLKAADAATKSSVTSKRREGERSQDEPKIRVWASCTLLNRGEVVLFAEGVCKQFRLVGWVVTAAPDPFFWFCKRELLVDSGFWVFLFCFKRRRRRRNKEGGWCFFCCRSKQNWRMSLILKPREAPMAVNSPSSSRLLFFFASFQPFPTSKKCISRVLKKLLWRLSSPQVSKNLNLWKLSSSLHTSIIYLWRKTSRNHPSFKEWERFLHDCRLWEELCNQESFRRCLDMRGVSIRAEGKRDMSLHMCVCVCDSLALSVYNCCCCCWLSVCPNVAD